MGKQTISKESSAILAQTLAHFAVKKKLNTRLFYSYFLISLISLLLLIQPKIFSQTESISERIIATAEELAANDPDPEAATDYISRLQELIEHPVDINSPDDDELSRLFFLSDFQIKTLQDYTSSTGLILSVYEIANIPGFDRETTAMMVPFIYVGKSTPPISHSSVLRNSLLTNFSIKPGTDDTSFLGSPWKILAKYKFTAGSISGGITSEKDAGEKYISIPGKMPDFLSAHLAYEGKGIIRKVIAGDFAASFGQGTNLNTGFRTGLSITSSGYLSGRNEIKQYTSTNEANFLRGIATELSVRNIAVSIFYSSRFSDATPGSPSGYSYYYIENLYTSGIHNTPSLLKRKNAISEQVYGLNLLYNMKNLRLGFTCTNNRLSLPIMSAGTDPEEAFNFNGSRNSLFTMYYNTLVNKILLYGELSVNQHYHYAVIQGISLRPADRLTVNLLYRKYDPGYTSFHGNGPGNSSGAQNEVGLLGNFTLEAAKHLFISFGCDVWRYPWLRYRCSAPSHGVKHELRTRYSPVEQLTIELSYQYRLTQSDIVTSTGISGQEDIRSESYKGTLKYSVTDNFKTVTRMDYRIIHPSGSSGRIILQDLIVSFNKIPVSVWLRYCLFYTDDYDSRIYTYENDLLYSFSIPSLSGKGSHSYFMIKWKISSKAEMRFRYGITTLTDTGRLPENREELKMQFRVSF